MKAKDFSPITGQRWLVSLAFAAVLFTDALLAASPPPQFTYQGRLMEIVNGVNTPVTSGTNTVFPVVMWVRLYESAGAAKSGALYGRKISTLVNDGQFALDIGDDSGEALPAVSSNLLALISGCSGSTLFVGITPYNDDNNEIQPRQPLISAPYALLANDVRQASGDFYATNGTSLFQALEVTGSARFLGAVTNQSAVSINGNVVFENGVTNLGPLEVRQISVVNLNCTGPTTVTYPINAGGNVVFDAGAVIRDFRPFAEVFASSLSVAGAMGVSGALSVTTPLQTSTPKLDFNGAAALVVKGKAVFGSYFTNSAVSFRSDVAMSASQSSVTADADGLYVFSVMVIKDGNATGSMTFNMGSPSVVSTTLTSNQYYGNQGYTLTLLLRKGESVIFGNGTNPNTTEKTRVCYRSFQRLF